MNLKPYYTIVENCIKELGVDPNDCRTDELGTWNLHKGSVDIYLQVFIPENRETGYFQCVAPVVEIPTDNRREFYSELLDLNHDICGVAFTKRNNIIFVKTIRELEGLSEEEAFMMITRVGNTADEYDDVFREKYNFESKNEN